MKKNYLFVVVFIFCFSFIGFTQGSWNAIPNAPQAPRFDDISFANDSVGFVCHNSSTVYKTSDKGNTWIPISALDTILYYVRSIEFINDSIGFTGLLGFGNALPGNLFKTTDGGYSWTLLQNMQILPGDGICSMAHFGNRLVAVGTYAGPAWFYKTDDFGNTWAKVDLSSLASALVDCIMINQDTILVSGMADSTNQLAATILQSTDGGINWQRVYLASTYYSYVWKMFFNPSGLGVASVETSGGVQMQTIARTTDNGNTWSTVNLNAVPFDADFGGIGMLNDTLGWVTEQYGSDMWETQDGGISWNQIVSSISAGDRMVLIDSVTMLAAGQTIYKYVLGSVGIPSPLTTNKENSHSLKVFPVPSKDAITIEVMALTNTFGLIDILDEKGIRVMQITRQPFPKGKSAFSVNLRNLSAGNYKVVWHNNEKLITNSLTIVR